MLAIGSTYHRPPPTPARLTIVLAAVLAGLTLSTATAPAALAARAATARAPHTAPAPQTLVITGAGDGHGVGMSQDGALGYAQHGWSYQAILAHYYTGTALGQAPADTSVRVLVGASVRKVPLERYVRGVVSAEMPASWPLAALEAQAIASRTYALTAHAGGSRFDVYSDTRSQVYLGAAAETAQTNAAVAATAGQIVTYAGQARDHLLLRQLRRDDRETCRTASRLRTASRGCRACPTPTTPARSSTGSSASASPPPPRGCGVSSRAACAASRC